jgi:hypothetical protein
LSTEQFEAGSHDLLHRIYDRRQNLIWHDFVRLSGQAVSQGASPGDPQFGIDVDDVDPSSNRAPEVFIVGTRASVQGEKDSSCLLDLGNSLDIQVLFSFPLYSEVQTGLTRRCIRCS